LLLIYSITSVQLKQDGLKLNGTHDILFYADGINILGGRVYTVKKTQKIYWLLVSRLDWK